VRCILTLPDSARATPADLVEAFAARSIEVREVIGPFRAMAELMRARRDDHCAIALVVMDPAAGAATRCAELMRAVDRWCPRAARWVYDEHAAPRLRRWVAPSDGTTPPVLGVNGIAGAIRDVTSPPSLRLIGGDHGPTTSPPAAASQDTAPEPPQDERASSADELTEDEIAMLLGLEANDPKETPESTGTPGGEPS